MSSLSIASNCRTGPLTSKKSDDASPAIAETFAVSGTPASASE